MIQPMIPTDFEQLAPRILVAGVGGAGNNALNNMIASDLPGVDYVALNTDNQALRASLAPVKIQLGPNITRGLGAGGKFEVGRSAAEESIDEIVSYLDGVNMVFITAGMGGGTGTGSAPVIARAARERGILTVGVVTKPFHFEGSVRMRQAEEGIKELQQYVDTLIVIPNQNLFRVAKEDTTFANAFKMADEVLQGGVRGITDVIVLPGIVNRDFNDVKTIMSEMGKAMLGTGEAEGAGRALKAAEAAISNPLLDDSSMKGARGVLICVSGGDDLTLYEMDEVTNRIRDEVDSDANIIWGTYLDPNLQGKIRVSLIATGIDAQSISQPVTDKFKMVVNNNAQPPLSAQPIPDAFASRPTAPTAQIFTQPRTNVATQPAAPQNNAPSPTPQTGTFGSRAGLAAATAARQQSNAAQSYGSAPQNIAGTMTTAYSQASVQAGNDYAPRFSAAQQHAMNQTFGQSVGSAALQIDPVEEFDQETVPSSWDQNYAENAAAPTQNQPRGLSVGPRPSMGEAQQFVERIDLMDEDDAVPPRLADVRPRPEAKKRGPSLFERVTGIAAGHKHETRPARVTAPAAPMQHDANLLSSLQQTSMQTPPAQPAPHLNLRPHNPVPQGPVKLSSQDEDLLDIPTFLRRQAN